jgi:hypothetical protein
MNHEPWPKKAGRAEREERTTEGRGDEGAENENTRETERENTFSRKFGHAQSVSQANVSNAQHRAQSRIRRGHTNEGGSVANCRHISRSVTLSTRYGSPTHTTDCILSIATIDTVRTGSLRMVHGSWFMILVQRFFFTPAVLGPGGFFRGSGGSACPQT